MGDYVAGEQRLWLRRQRVIWDGEWWIVEWEEIQKNVEKKIRNNEKLFTMTVLKNAAAFHA